MSRRLLPSMVRKSILRRFRVADLHQAKPMPTDKPQVLCVFPSEVFQKLTEEAETTGSRIQDIIRQMAAERYGLPADPLAWGRKGELWGNALKKKAPAKKQAARKKTKP